jgi:hypothetical protein
MEIRTISIKRNASAGKIGSLVGLVAESDREEGMVEREFVAAVWLRWNIICTTSMIYGCLVCFQDMLRGEHAECETEKIHVFCPL